MIYISILMMKKFLHLQLRQKEVSTKFLNIISTVERI